ncbi:MAG: tRNA (N(6)-L-threonylcarbamoyladenosine(37)-C(2))-methylthiotransferase [Candidatus Bathyarchaeota archaeon]|jgi:MiaB-like tRNA modifying enzyme
MRRRDFQVFVRSFGCPTNLADGEVLAGCLAEAGYKIVNDLSVADIILCNTCGVKGPTEDRMISLLKRFPSEKKLVIAGCLPLINFERLCKEVSFDGVLGPASGDKIVDVMKLVLDGKHIVRLGEAEMAKPSLMLPRIRVNPIVGIIPINYGCLGSCAYCCVVSARGRLRSYKIEEILQRAYSDLADGVREFWITSQDTACYGKDIGSTLADLLKALDKLEGDFRIRVGMMTPNLAKDILTDLIEAFQSEKIFKFVHFPVQSGDDQILQRMRRIYSVDDFKEIVNTFRSSFSSVTLATDIICGFPGETKEAFERSLNLIEEVEPDIVNISKFHARPNTSAAAMQKDSVPPREIKRRSTVMSQLTKKIALKRNRRWIGWNGKVFVDEVGKVPGSWIGRNHAYKPIVLKHASDSLISETLNLRIIDASTTYLKGEVIK